MLKAPGTARAVRDNPNSVSIRVSSSRLIGRAAELAALEAALADACIEQPVGRVRGRRVGRRQDAPARRARAHARASGTRWCSAGDCVDLGESELPYAAARVRPAPARPLRRRSADRLGARRRRAAAARLGAPTAPAPARDRPGAAVRGLLSLLDALGRERPVLLVIEDLHWADRSTRAALAFLARSLTRRARARRRHLPPRRAAPPPPAPLAAGRARARPAHPSRRARAAHARRARRSARGHPRRGARRRAAASASGRAPSGNPLFAEELLAAGVDGRGAPPDTLRDALMLRVERLLRRRAGGPPRSSRSASGSTTPCSPRSAGSTPRALRDALREAVDEPHPLAGDDGWLPVPPRPAARGRRRRPAARRARDAAPARSPRRCGTALKERDGAVRHRRDRPPLRRRRRPARGARVVGPRRRAPPSACTRTARRRRCSSAPSSCGTACPTPRERGRRRPGDAARARRRVPPAALGHAGRQLALFEAALAELGPEPDPVRASLIIESIARAPVGTSTARDRASRRSSARSSWSRAPTATPPPAARPRARRPRAPLHARRQLARQRSRSPARRSTPRSRVGMRSARGARPQHARLLAGDGRRGRRRLGRAARGDPHRPRARRPRRSRRRLTRTSPTCSTSWAARRRRASSPRRSRGVRRAPPDRDHVARRAARGDPGGHRRLTRRRRGCPIRCGHRRPRAGQPRPAACPAARSAEASTTPRAIFCVELDEMIADSSEPQLIGPLAVMLAEQQRREGDLAAARETWSAARPDGVLHRRRRARGRGRRRRRDRRGRRRPARPRPRRGLIAETSALRFPRRSAVARRRRRRPHAPRSMRPAPDGARRGREQYADVQGLRARPTHRLEDLPARIARMRWRAAEARVAPRRPRRRRRAAEHRPRERARRRGWLRSESSCGAPRRARPAVVAQEPSGRGRRGRLRPHVARGAGARAGREGATNRSRRGCHGRERYRERARLTDRLQAGTCRWPTASRTTTAGLTCRSARHHLRRASRPRLVPIRSAAKPFRFTR